MATLTGYLRDNDGIYIVKDPSANLDYSIDWGDWLPAGSTISTSSWTLEDVAGDTTALSGSGAQIIGNKTVLTINGGTSGYIYKVYNTITTSGGLTERRYFRIKVEARSL